MTHFAPLVNLLPPPNATGKPQLHTSAKRHRNTGYRANADRARSGLGTRDNPPVKCAEILWYSAEDRSSEHCTLSKTDEGWLIGGWTVLPIAGVPSHIRYQVQTDHHWSTQRASIEVESAVPSSIEVTVSGRRWSIAGERRPDLDGCTDIDLGWTPATNLLPIRRLNLEIGDTATVDAAWLRFPELEFEHSEQRYVRTGGRRWRYESGSYGCELVTNDVGFVVDYDDGLWTAVADVTASDL